MLLLVPKEYSDLPCLASLSAKACTMGAFTAVCILS